MKKVLAIIMVLVFAMNVSACGGNVSDVEISDYSSEIYTDTEIEDAIAVTMEYFKEEFSGCTLKTITYAGDDKSKAYLEWAKRNNADETIVLISSFGVGTSGGDGSLNPGSTYDDWMWVLVRDDDGEWCHVDHGY